MTKLKVFQKPSVTSALMGHIKMISRLPLHPYKPPGDGCSKFWLKVEEDSWVCGAQLLPDKRPPLLKIQPLMEPGAVLPSLYGWIRSSGADSFATQADVTANKPNGKLRAGTMVRWVKTFSIGGQPYWHTSKKIYIPASRIFRHTPSKFHGIDLRQTGWALPVAIVRGKTSGAAVYDKPGGQIVSRAEHHSRWEILDQAKVGITRFYKIKPGWILARRVISAWPTEPPAGLKECEKWVEVVVEHQSLVAYEGPEPVYMTMLSSGDKKHPTKYGIFRLWWKKAQDDMTSPGMMGGEFYRVDDVPWALFFWRGMAFHAAYWHTDFGNRRSHGCINMSPMDAKWLYDWTEPKVPPGWMDRRGNELSPGTLVRIRHKVDHHPPFHGYARKLAPAEAVRTLDDARKERMQKKTLQLIQTKGAR